MTFSSAYLYAKQITAGEVPGLDVVWFNSKNTNPMQSFGDSSNPFIRRNTSGANWTSFLSRNSMNYSEPPADFIGCAATPMSLSDLPLMILLISASLSSNIFAISFALNTS